ncbi:hypothetical protein KY092_06175 [Natronomonas gomsonensis]|uniref:hypothetical protein n=1 Tax=Natronomonas gomsonensis TaxID=1046043 RepID=UPI0020CA5E37|nr:hypothetical protein [Natronomonas gomsonensis]MCY4730141.1 hypothetical protein [Natronomonas gomsonensis]
MASDGNALERLGEYILENRGGIVTDLVFAVVWVTLVTVIFRFVDGPDWAYYLLMVAGVVAYYGFFLSLEVALASADER